MKSLCVIFQRKENKEKVKYTNRILTGVVIFIVLFLNENINFYNQFYYYQLFCILIFVNQVLY